MLEHPGIVPIHQISRSGDDEIEVVMKRIQGRTLTSYIYDRPCSDVDWGLEILIQVCNAVEYAHRKNVIHRDIKSDNIMIGEVGEVYLLDWGIAVHNHNGHINFPIAIVGTPSMMAPEILKGIRMMLNLEQISICWVLFSMKYLFGTLCIRQNNWMKYEIKFYNPARFNSLMKRPSHCKISLVGLVLKRNRLAFQLFENFEQRFKNIWICVVFIYSMRKAVFIRMPFFR